ncbi:MAG: hypothetical protein U0796_04680 [Gemmatales bacterium]
MLALVLCVLPTFADDTAVVTPTAEMKPIAYLAGNWHGSGWVQMREGRQTFTVKEKVEPKLNGGVFLVEGIGKAPDGRVVHHALAFFHYDSKAGEFRIKAFRRDGGYVDAKGEMKDGKFVWGFDQPQAGKVRFTIHQNDKGQWHEMGEFSQDGKQWRQFLEMTLDRVK